MMPQWAPASQGPQATLWGPASLCHFHLWDLGTQGTLLPWVPPPFPSCEVGVYRDPLQVVGGQGQGVGSASMRPPA